MDGLQMMPVDSIISCASDRNYTFILLKDNRKIVVSKMLKGNREKCLKTIHFFVYTTLILLI